jgi:hypothetical protein
MDEDNFYLGLSYMIMLLVLILFFVLLHYLGFTLDGAILLLLFICIFGCIWVIYSARIKDIQIIFSIFLFISVLSSIYLLGKPLYKGLPNQ